MLTSLQHYDQVGKVVCFLSTREDFLVILFVILITELFQDIEHNLRVNACHSECLQETSHTYLNIAIRVVLPLKVLL